MSFIGVIAYDVNVYSYCVLEGMRVESGVDNEPVETLEDCFSGLCGLIGKCIRGFCCRDFVVPCSRVISSLNAGLSGR